MNTVKKTKLVDISSLPNEFDFELKEIEEYNKAKSINNSVNRLDFGSGFYKCYKWMIKELSK